MKRTLIAASCLALLACAVLTSLSCAAARDVRDRITGGGTPGPTRTATSTATPTATPTPVLPPNPGALNRWSKLPVTYCVSSDGGGYVSNNILIVAVQRAFTTWGVPALYNGECGPPRRDDGVNEIGWGVLGSDAQPVYEAGLTQRTVSQCRSNCDPENPVELVEADIIIDSDAPEEFRTATCLYATVLHETGHFLGLEHLPEPAVMEAETSACRTRLTDLDIAALLQRYGARANPP